MKIKRTTYLIIPLLTLTFLGASCGKKTDNTLNRPALSSVENNANTNNEPAVEDDNGQVAGTTTVVLPTKKIKINDVEIDAELANTEESQVRGLSGREKLEDGKGMLFDFTNNDYKQPGFWMKDMLISIDIIWIANGKIIGVKDNAPLPPEDGDLPIYYPPSNITHVLEVPAGWVTKNKITVGSTVSL